VLCDSPSRKVLQLRSVAREAQQKQAADPHTTNVAAPPENATTFPDAIEADKHFERRTHALFDEEFRGRLNIAVSFSSALNTHYVSMNKAYVRWVETGLNPDEPDPPEKEHPDVVAERLAHRETMVQRIVEGEERRRCLLFDSAVAALEAHRGLLLLLLEEEAMRRHMEGVMEPERWSKITQRINWFLAHRLVDAPRVFHEWSLGSAALERQCDHAWSTMRSMFDHGPTLGGTAQDSLLRGRRVHVN
jgi:hypothetical protein